MKRLLRIFMLMTIVMALPIAAMSQQAQLRGQKMSSKEISKTTVTQKAAQNQTFKFERNFLPYDPLLPPCPDTLLFEDFESQLIPASWQNLDLDGNTDANGRPANFYITADLETTVGTDTNWVAASSSWFTPFAQANNWLILPSINICNNAVIQWKSAPFEGPGFMDGYKVLVSTTTNVTTAFTDTIAVIAEDVAGGSGVPGPGWVHTSFNGTRGILQTWTVDLSSYYNQTIYIAFVHDSDDDNLLLLDDIFIGEVPAIDAELVSAEYPSEYTIVPEDFVTPLTFAARVANNGSQPISNVKLHVEVTSNSTSLMEDSVGIATLASLADTLLTILTPFTPPAVGDYDINYWVTINELDSDTNNNDLMTVFSVTDSVYARDESIVSGSLSIGAGALGFIGQEYDLPVAGSLLSLDFYRTGGVIGDTVTAQVYSMTPSGPGSLIATSAMLVATANDTAGLLNLTFTGGPISLAPGAYCIGIEESVSTSMTLGYSDNIFTLGRTWVYFNGSWSNSEDFSFYPAYILRPIFVDPCSNPVSAFTENGNGLTVSFTDASTVTAPATYIWDFGDGNTSTMQNPTHTYAAAGTYTVCLIVSDVCGTDSSCQNVQVVNVGVEEVSLQDVINVYPSPANDVVNVSYHFPENTNAQLRVLNVIGQEFSKRELNNVSKGSIQLNVKDYNDGIYFVEFQTGFGKVVKRIMIVH